MSRIFVSYAREDSAYVTPIVTFLRAALYGLHGFELPVQQAVFQDSDSIDPGTKWREAIAKAIRLADKVLVFWCAHSSASVEVRSEYELALQLEKVVVPVLLDASPLAERLSELQAVDLTGLRGWDLHDSPLELHPLRGGHPWPYYELVHRVAGFFSCDEHTMLESYINNLHRVEDHYRPR